jgi:hypothetical protein
MNKKLLLIALISMSIFAAGCTNQKTKEAQNQSDNNTQIKTENTEKQASKDSSTANKSNTVIANPTPNNSATTNSTGTVKQPQETFYGQWVIKKPLAYGRVGTYGSDNTAQLIGRNLSFSKEKATCFGDAIQALDNVVISPVYKKIVVSKVDFETANPTVTFDKLGIKADSIIQVDIVDSKYNGCTFFIKDNNTLILYGGGTFFELVR